MVVGSGLLAVDCMQRDDEAKGMFLIKIQEPRHALFISTDLILGSFYFTEGWRRLLQRKSK